MLKIEGALELKYRWIIAKLKEDLNIAMTEDVQALMFEAFCDLVEYDELEACIRAKLGESANIQRKGR